MQTCYRHPDRETGVSCSNCERPICPDCMTSTPVGMRCPECARQKTKVTTMAAAGTEPVLTYILIGVNVALALGDLLSGGGGLAGGSLTDDGAVSRFAVDDGEWWRIITAGFLHYGFFHLALNMLVLWFIGTELEPALGRLRFGVIYFVSLLGGSFGALLLEENARTAGASGAVFGLMGAAVVVMRSQGINPLQSNLGILIVLNLVLSLRPGISLGGHLGGFVAGIIAAALIVELRGRVPQIVPVLLAAALGVAAFVGSIVVSSSAG